MIDAAISDMRLPGGRADPRSEGLPLVTVIVATRDRSDSLEETLASIREQRYPRIEIIVVDDGSRDETPALVGKLARADPRMTVLRNETPRGPAGARNTGAAEARGFYLLFEDDDCRSHPERVGCLVGALRKNRNTAYAYCWLRSQDVDGSVEIHGRTGAWSIGTPYALIDASAFREVGGFDEELPRAVDFDLWTRILARHDAVEVPRVLVETVRDESGISSSRERLRRACVRLLDKYRGSRLAPEHLAEMHRRIGLRATTSGLPWLGVRHFVRAIRYSPAEYRSWVGLMASLGGRTGVKATDRVHRLLGWKGRASPLLDAGHRG